MDSLTFLVSITRGVQMAALVSLFGALLFRAVIAPRLKLQRLIAASLVVALLAACVWLLIETAVIAGTSGLPAAIEALPAVAGDTRFGHALLLRLGLLLVTGTLLRRRWPPTVLAALALVLQADMGHAAAMGGRLGAGVATSEAFHLLAAGIWLGGLMPLYIATGRLPAAEAGRIALRFSPVALSAVLVIAATALVQVETLVGGLPGLLGTAYGRVALLKLGLFIALLIVALINRFRLAPALETGQAREAKAHLLLSLTIEASLGLAVVLAAGALASLPPGMHEQPIWPLPFRPSLAAFAEPSLKLEILLGLAGIGLGIGLIVAGLVIRRRSLALAAAAVVFVLSWPHVALLFVPAYPTSYFRSPTGFAAESIARSARLFGEHCASCHGPEGKPQGNAQNLTADLTAAHLWEHSDGELFWWLAHGIDSPSGVRVMPGFADTLSDDDRWALIDYVRANNAGIRMRETGTWPVAIQAPAFTADCKSGSTVSTDDLRGQVYRIVAGAKAPPSPGIVTLWLEPEESTQPNNACIDASPDTWTAYAIVTGTSPSALEGTQFLVDRDGWLRRRLPADDADIAALARDLDQQQLKAHTGSLHAHHH
jgi:putative copper export protein/mono/diheme cytochrome c family protein